MPTLIEPSELPRLLRPGMRVFVAGGPSEPHTLVAALRAAPEANAGVTFIQSLVPGLNRTDFTELHPEARITTFFMTPQTQRAYAEGRVDFVPMQLRVIADYLRETPVDVALMQFAPGDEEAFSAGLNADYVDSILDHAGCIVAEVNRAMPAPARALRVPMERVAYVLESDRPPDVYPLADPSPEALAIGRHVAGIVRDGDCIQTGIGAIPYAVLSALGDKNDLGLHSGLLDDGARRLAEAGVLTGRRKSRDQGLMVTGNIIGSAELYAWAGSRPDVAVRPFSYTHDASVLASIDDFVSVNSAIEVDFHGQVNSEMIRGRQITGTGGSVDFIRGAAASRGGRSIIALTATAGGGKVSRIVPLLETGNAATALRTDVDYLVTEHGAARLRYLPVPERARALVEIAAPEFRDALRDRAREIFGR